MKLQPFVKWAGGKRQIIDKLLKLMPKKFNHYYEPFVGGGALFLEIAPNRSVINDCNYELIAIYKCLRNEKKFQKMKQLCKQHEANHSEEYYYKIRNIDKNHKKFWKMSLSERAARCLYLNKACFNGLYRVNKNNEFNVPFGKKEKIKCYNEDNIKAIHQYFLKSKPVILNKDFFSVIKNIKHGDFVYFDPPYDTVKADSFTSYSSVKFTKKDQIKLESIVENLTAKGVCVMVSNANTDFIRNIYKNFNIHVIQAKRIINSNTSGRGAIEELIITNY